MTDVIKQIKEYLNKHHLSGENILIGLSGGVDSVALFRGLIELRSSFNLKIFALYVHHGIRDDADEDVKLCEGLCSQYGVSLKIVYLDIPQAVKETKKTEEEVAREFRYDALRKELKNIGGGFIAVAHHMEDQAETVLHRLVRGSGGLGLSAMHEITQDIIRPLLAIHKADLIAFVKAFGLEYRTDYTNFDTTYTRNHIRHELIPYLKENYNTNIVESLYRTSQLLGDEEVVLNEYTRNIFQTLAEHKKDKNQQDNKVCLNIEAVNKQHISMQRRLLRHGVECVKGNGKNIEFAHIEAILQLMKSQSGKYIDLPEELIAMREYNSLLIGYKSNLIKKERGFSYKLDTVPIKGYIQKANMTFSAKILSKSEYKALTNYKDSLKKSKNVYTKWFDYDKIKANVVLRSRLSGDFIRIHKDGGSKTIKKYFIDEKIPVSERDRILLLTVGSEVLWVVGYRTNPAYEVSEDSYNILEVELRS